MNDKVLNDLRATAVKYVGDWFGAEVASMLAALYIDRQLMGLPQPTVDEARAEVYSQICRRYEGGAA